MTPQPAIDLRLFPAAVSCCGTAWAATQSDSRWLWVAVGVGVALTASWVTWSVSARSRPSAVGMGRHGTARHHEQPRAAVPRLGRELGERELRVSAWVGSGVAAATVICAAALPTVLQQDTSPMAEAASAREIVRLHGTVATRPRPIAPEPGAAAMPPRVWTTLRATIHQKTSDSHDVVGAPVLVTVFGDTSLRDVRPGSSVAVTARLAPPQATRRSVAVASALAGTLVVEKPPSGVWAVVDHLHDALGQGTAQLPPDGQALLLGLVLGADQDADPELVAAMRHAGLAHLTAVSGSNIALVSGLVLWLVSWLVRAVAARAAAAASVMAGYVLAVGPEPSVLRAAVMGALVLVAMATYRGSGGAPALCCAVIVVLAADPWLVHHVGLWLSVAATAAIVFAAPPVTSWLLARPVWVGRIRWQLPTPVAGVVSVSAVATAATAPIAAATFGTLTPYSVPANIAAAPLVPVATLLGLIGMVVAAVIPAWAPAVLWLPGHLAAGVGGIARVVTTWPGATLTTSDVSHMPWSFADAWPVTVAVAACVGAGVAVRRVAHHRWVKPVAVWACAGTCIVAAAVMTTDRQVFPLPGRGSTGWQVAACDVGQGAAFAVNTGDGHAVLIDAGPDPAALHRCLARLQVTVVDALVITHFHLDHVGAASDLLNKIPVGEVWATELAAPAAFAGVVADAADMAGVPITYPTAGQRLYVGGVAVTAWPAAPATCTPTTCESENINDASLSVTVTTADLTALFPGDSEWATQRRLAQVVAEQVGPVDVLATAHHGSATQVPNLYTAAAARVHLISVGADNDYGHPAPSTLDLLAQTGGIVTRTDHHGTITVTSQQVLTSRGAALG